MSHELRTPLNAIIGFSQIWMEELFGEIKNPKYKEYAKDINTAGTHLLLLIGDILDIAKVDSGELDLFEREIHVGQLLASSVDLVHESARNKQIVPQITVEPDDLALFADERLLRQTLVNLLGNSVKFTPEGGSICLAANINAQNQIELTVSDTGCGMNASEVQQVTEPFVQGQQDPDLARDGVGLGLPLALRFIELHQGKMDIQSGPELGTRVIIQLPNSRRVYPDGSSQA